jgi:ABC-type antimicrobial peptide transport system permease subunit
MWFTDSEIRTKALQKLVWKNNNKLESKIIELLYEFLKVPKKRNPIHSARYFQYARKNVQKPLLDCKRHPKASKRNWKLEPQNNSLAYIKYDIDYSGSFYQNNKTGRYFTIKKDFILQKFDEMMN